MTQAKRYRPKKRLAADLPIPRAYQAIRQILSKASDPVGLKVLDVRCRGGRGRPYLPLDLDYFGIDPRPMLVKMAVAQNIPAAVVDVEKTDAFPQENDAVICVGLNELKQPSTALYRMAQATKKTGVVIFTIKGRFYRMQDEDIDGWRANVQAAVSPWFGQCITLLPPERDFLFVVCCFPVHYQPGSLAAPRGVSLAALKVPELALAKR